uniref:uncharacterized protein LOC131107494 isoform X1 n=1 Tax=Doryrhamphus excisus TaxID=161450 RepID=UPI0025AE910C|nr:uncharacterized protein LOC131107494 isoform X1 [Doryrhamphus excisus]
MFKLATKHLMPFTNFENTSETSHVIMLDDVMAFLAISKRGEMIPHESAILDGCQRDPGLLCCGPPRHRKSVGVREGEVGGGGGGYLLAATAFDWRVETGSGGEEGKQGGSQPEQGRRERTVWMVAGLACVSILKAGVPDSSLLGKRLRLNIRKASKFLTQSADSSCRPRGGARRPA